jgi:hypothetical protein
MGVSCGSTSRALKKHLHLRPKEITAVPKLKAWDKAKRVEYCRWFRDVITANGEATVEVILYLSMRNCFTNPVTSAPKRLAVGQD